ncbi:MAG: amino acid ABC transporter permease [Armatimonadota bacterium]|nr:amino acid ABC transporter permease [Armatimonadota bacterium]MDR7450785.1 amino acid ABC transporter permease [Armatimonadota bacterium]MDR7466141.1 amino acid ABC transporter permease [Armatimonadota bacterium]MDR7493822.1 amino acid ABC transporter permease [Armatimonadota bacterium]MDR7499017.1 amino acid ABC transporter permease [Armatimonadota bacterium]
MRWEVVRQTFSYLLQGLEATVVLGVGVMVLGTLLGAVLALMRLARRRPVAVPAAGFVELFRDTPLIMQMFFMFFGLPALGIRLPSLMAATLAMTFFASANAAEIIRGAIQSIPHGQMEAARSLGLSYLASMRLVIVPQAVRRMIPPMMGLFTTLIKDTSLAAIINVFELTTAARQVVERTLASFEIWLVAAALYFAVCYPVSVASQRLEQRFTAEAGR